MNERLDPIARANDAFNHGEELYPNPYPPGTEENREYAWEMHTLQAQEFHIEVRRGDYGSK